MTDEEVEEEKKTSGRSRRIGERRRSEEAREGKGSDSEGRE